MITAAKFYGNALYWSGATIYRVPARVLNIGTVPAGPGLTLPSRTGLCPGGPYFKLINPSGGSSIPLKQPGGAALITMAVNTLTTVLLGTSKWYAKARTLNANRAFSSTSADRTEAVGYLPTVAPVTPPLSYDSFLCDGGYRRARFCVSGAKANLWMLDSEVTPNFVSGIAAFTYSGQCFYFNESERLLISHGDVVASASVTWYDTCSDCLVGLLCDFTNPNMPQAIRVKIIDNVNTIVAGRDDFNVGGTWTLYSDGSSQYKADYTSPKPAGYCLLSNMSIKATCSVGGWDIQVQYSGGLGATHNVFSNVGAQVVGPTIGAYPVSASGGSGSFSTGAWDAATVEVIGWGG